MRASRDGAYGERRGCFHDRRHEAGLLVELPALRCGQLAQWFDGDGERAAGAPLVPDPADHAVDEQDWVVSGLARRSERAGGGTSAVAAPAPAQDRQPASDASVIILACRRQRARAAKFEIWGSVPKGRTGCHLSRRRLRSALRGHRSGEVPEPAAGTGCRSRRRQGASACDSPTTHSVRFESTA